MTPEQRQLQIAKCINAVARYYGVSASKVYESRYSKNPLCHKARVVLWNHLHQSGMTNHEIASAFKLTYDNVQKHTKAGKSGMTPEDLMLMKTLPTIDTTLDFAEA